MYDAVVVGGGPAGLTAALYLARFHLSVFLADGGESRAALIPESHNLPFWPEGISGVELLDRMRRQTLGYPVTHAEAAVTEIRRPGAGFEIVLEGQVVTSKAVILATGVENRRPEMDDLEHAEALARGLLRYCPICDGYEVTDQPIAIVGTGDRLVGETRFLRSYTGTITVFSETGMLGLSVSQRHELSDLGVEMLDMAPDSYRLGERCLEVAFGSERRTYRSMYAALGSEIRSGLAVGLGADVTEDGCVVVDTHQRTTVPGLYAAGDVVSGVDQIGYAIGQAVVAATALRNDLCDRDPILRSGPHGEGGRRQPE
jgi:thioredoxin reductase (NADPH)